MIATDLRAEPARLPEFPDRSSPPARGMVPRRWTTDFRLVVGGALVLAVLFAVPTLSAPFFRDDYVLVATEEGRAPWMARPLDLFRFSTGKPSDVQAYVADGRMPWWTSPVWRFAPWRPLGSALFAGDHALFGRNPVGYRLHSLVWLLCMVTSVGLLYRRVLAGPVALLALWLFAIADITLATFGWLSSRHFLVTCTFGTLALWSAQRTTSGTHRWVSAGLFGLALLAGETAYQIFAYFIAFELFNHQETWKQRLHRMAPLLGVIVVYLLVYTGLDRGIRGDGAYTDPVAEPLRFLTQAATVIPEHLCATLLGPLSLFLGKRPLLGFLIPSAFAGLLVASWRFLTPAERQQARWLGLGALLAYLPAAAGAGGERLRLAPSLGATALYALSLVAAVRAVRAKGGARVRRGLALGLGLAVATLHLILVPSTWWRRVGFTVRLARHEASAVSDLTLDTRVTQVVVIRAPTLMWGPWAQAIRETERSEASPPWWTLSMGMGEHERTRSADHVLHGRVGAG